MGLPMSLLAKLGLPGINSAATSQVYKRYFENKNIKSVEEFHIYFVEFCKDFNAVLPGKHYDVTQSREQIEDFFNKEWKECRSDDEKKRKFLEFMEKNLSERKTNPKAMIVTGLAVPASALALKRTGENMPAVKKFRLHLIPDFLFVPSCTLAALIGVRVLQIKSQSKP